MVRPVVPWPLLLYYTRSYYMYTWMWSKLGRSNRNGKKKEELLKQHCFQWNGLPYNISWQPCAVLRLIRRGVLRVEIHFSWLMLNLFQNGYFRFSAQSREEQIVKQNFSRIVNLMQERNNMKGAPGLQMQLLILPSFCLPCCSEQFFLHRWKYTKYNRYYHPRLDCNCHPSAGPSDIVG